MHVFRLLKRHEKGPPSSFEKLHEELDALPVDSRDRNLARNIAFGVTKARETLDHIIRRFSDLPLQRVRGDVLLLLRIALYQVLFLGKIPDYASVDSTVTIAGKVAGRKTAGFANAVLRKVIRSVKDYGDLDAPPSPSVCYGPTVSVRFSEDIFPSPETRPAEYLSRAYSYPAWLVRKWLGDHSFGDVVALLRAGNTIRPIFFWINPMVGEGVKTLESLRKEGVLYERAAEGLYRCQASFLPGLKKHLDSGRLYIQDKTPFEICRAALPYLGAMNLDVCAGVGGKSLCLSALSSKPLGMVAVEPERSRFARLRANIKNMGQSSITPMRCDAFSLPADYKGRFDCVITDVPCSNSGVFARRADARWRVSARSLRNLCALQKRVAMRAFDHLKPSGRLVYSTCSIDKEENSEIVLHFCRSFSDICLMEEKVFRPQPAPESGDGGYVAVLKKSPGES
jgi:16S rRNA (cytosine967-C5)-methyltransferase